MEFQSQLFVNHSPVVYTTLDTHLTHNIHQRRICPLTGPDGSGKTWMLGYWLAQSLHAPHILSIRMYHSTIHTSGDTADKATLLCFSALDHALHLRELQATGLLAENETTKGLPLWTKQQYYRFFHGLGYRLRKQHIHALIIDQAQHIGANTWEELVALRDQCDESLALIPCISYRGSGTAQEAWSHVAKRMRVASAPLMDIPCIPADHFQTTLIELWTKRGITLDSGVHGYMASIAEKLWTVTHGDWHAIMGIQATLDAIRNDTTIVTMKHLHAMMRQYGLVKKIVHEEGKS